MRLGGDGIDPCAFLVVPAMPRQAASSVRPAAGRPSCAPVQTATLVDTAARSTRGGAARPASISKPGSTSTAPPSPVNSRASYLGAAGRCACIPFLPGDAVSVSAGPRKAWRSPRRPCAMRHHRTRGPWALRSPGLLHARTHREADAHGRAGLRAAGSRSQRLVMRGAPRLPEFAGNVFPMPELVTPGVPASLPASVRGLRTHGGRGGEAGRGARPRSAPCLRQGD